MHRAPGPGERQRDAERSKQQLLAAAVTEFASRGFGGARVSDIADRAGVNKQLISYYFGGKLGLYQAVSERWRDGEQTVTEGATTLPEVVAAYARASLAEPDLARLLIRQGVDQEATEADREGQQARFQGMLADFRARQKQGELAADLDPAYVGLAMFALSAAPVTFPQIAQALGLDPAAPGFAGKYAEQVALIVSRLADR
ncbi:TetR family transcriptional regulator [Kribbella qitaiheensis]|uniref:TetR family transcriptional regulator n=1 Tax=Kribbella qitaiheensis TaxID=1544730 RepID=A0A7G6X3N8_9ACTN|nr:TetR family transcriptional regulator [Kribbella qitaiheensis]QNE20853.1 TetR family transcriptional regulator [Kribbella qitaiheensis]